MNRPTAGPAPAPRGYQSRGASADDIPAIADLHLACDVHDAGSADYTESDLLHDWRLPGFDPAADVQLVLADDGLVVGFAWTWARGGNTDLVGWGAVHPDHRGRGIGTHLVRAREARARELASQARAGSRVRVQSDVAGRDQAGHRLLEAHGYQLVRHHWKMEIELDRHGSPPTVPSAPAGVSLRRFIPREDDRRVHAAIEESFAEHWGRVPWTFEEWTARNMGHDAFDPSLWLVAQDGDEVVGALLGYLEEGYGWVGSLGVRLAWRRRGIGACLLARSFAEFHARGCTRVGLDVDAENETGATDLYRRAGMQVSRKDDNYEKWLT